MSLVEAIISIDCMCNTDSVPFYQANLMLL
jgi:hypothetical protein